MAVVIVDVLEMIEIEHRQQQGIAVLLPLADFMLQALAPGCAIGQAGQRVDQGFLALFFEVFTITLGFLLHAGHPRGQALQARRDFLLALVTLLLVLIHGAQQTFKVVLQHVLEPLEVSSLLHAALQAVDLFTDLRIQFPRRRAVVGVACAGRLQVALERLQALVELFEVDLELMLATVGDRQHQHRQVIEDRQQFVPVQPVFQALAHGFGLRSMAFGQRQVVQQPQQRAFYVLGHRAIGGFGRIRQRIEQLRFARLGFRLGDDVGLQRDHGQLVRWRQGCVVVQWRVSRSAVGNRFRQRGEGRLLQQLDVGLDLKLDLRRHCRWGNYRRSG